MKLPALPFALATLLSFGAHAEPDDQEPVQFVRDYAAARGVTIVEARQQLSISDQAIEVKLKAEAEFPGTFGGLYIQNTPNYRVIVKFSRDAETSLRALTSNPAFVAVQSPYSIRELEAKGRQIEAILDAEGIESSTNVDPKETELRVWVDEAKVEAVRALLLERGVDLSSTSVVALGKIELTASGS
ncbi:hypothetical protein K4L06_06090 [Lysobacter sp. BMK333-48F3]|uniref:hypothetical protein n=1 Tax=Lysobacter sp. BMK333-48F3 TaxID=2867962 RepID=UPI001C8CA94B|nr:hypothetical protein [Lysobacter sp. BMK333-48F3]MBX9400876.1 hypothetical protein [Lysobacter sp. BMK333-48F3]